MEIELLKRVIVSNRQLVADIPVLNRSYSLDAAMNYVFTGVRQSGKTYLIYQSIQELLRQGIDIRTIVYINFDDERLIGFAPADFELLLQEEDVSLSCFLMKYRMFRRGKNLPAVWQMKSTESILPAAMHKCSVRNLQQSWVDVTRL